MEQKSTIEELVNAIYEMIQDAWSVPLGDKCLLERDKALDILDELRSNIPSDIRLAKDIVNRRNEVIAAGQREADAIKKQAEEYAKQMINEHEIVVEARRKAAEITNSANVKSKELKKLASEYCEDTLKQAEQEVLGTLEGIKRAKQIVSNLKKS